MGQEMNLSQLPRDTLVLLKQVLENYSRMTKADEGTLGFGTQYISHGCAADESLREAVLESDWSHLDAPTSRKMVLVVDFMVVAFPDNHAFKWREDIAKLSSLLKKRFHSAFGKSVYAAV